MDGTPPPWSCTVAVQNGGVSQASSQSPNRAFAAFVTEGVHVGFDCGTECDETQVLMPALRSAELNPATIDAYLTAEVADGRLTQSASIPHKYARGIPIGLVDKKAKYTVCSGRPVFTHTPD
jgi:hypothetical protein